MAADRMVGHAEERQTSVFRISIAQPVLEDLKERLGNTRWIRPLQEGGWRRGSDPLYLRSFAMAKAD